MGKKRSFWGETKGLIVGFKAVYFEAGKEDFFLQEMNKINQTLFIETVTKNLFSGQFKDFKQLGRLETLEQQQELPEYFRQKKEALLKKYNVNDSLEAMAEMGISFNDIYNSQKTVEEKWVNLRVAFLDYQIKNRAELKRLGEIEKVAGSFRMDKLAEKAGEYYSELKNEEAQLAKKIANLRPGKRVGLSTEIEIIKATEELEYNLSLYREDGRALRAYSVESLLREREGRSLAVLTPKDVGRRPEKEDREKQPEARER